MTGSFEFDFALSKEGEGGNDPSVNANNLDINADIASELISKLTERAEKKADACTTCRYICEFILQDYVRNRHCDTISDNTADLIPGV